MFSAKKQVAGEDSAEIMSGERPDAREGDPLGQDKVHRRSATSRDGMDMVAPENRAEQGSGFRTAERQPVDQGREGAIAFLLCILFRLLIIGDI